MASGFLVGGAGGDLAQHFDFARGQELATGEVVGDRLLVFAAATGLGVQRLLDGGGMIRSGVEGLLDEVEGRRT